MITEHGRKKIYDIKFNIYWCRTVPVLAALPTFLKEWNTTAVTRCALAVSGTAIAICPLALNQGQGSKSDSDKKSNFHHGEPVKGF